MLQQDIRTVERRTLKVKCQKLLLTFGRFRAQNSPEPPVMIVVYTRGFHSEIIVSSGLERPLVVQYGNIK